MAKNSTKLALAGGLSSYLLASYLRKKRALSFQFDGKVVLLTGGSRGLGLAMAQQLVQEGAKLVICGRSEEKLAQAKELIGSGKGSLTSFPCDVSSRAQVQQMIAEIEVSLGPIDVLINNAGQIIVGPLATMNLADFEQMMQVHYWGPIYAIEAVLPTMRARGSGRIVNISSIGGKIALPHLTAYSSSKFALAGLSQGLHSELKKEGIHVTSVYPGLMRTGSPRHAHFKGQHKAEYSWFMLSDSLPLLSINAQRAAQKILHACKAAKAQLVISLPAKMAITFHSLMPTLAAELAAFINRLLPAAQEAETEQSRQRGEDSETRITQSALTSLSRQAEKQLNQLG